MGPECIPAAPVPGAQRGPTGHGHQKSGNTSIETTTLNVCSVVLQMSISGPIVPLQ